MRTVWKYVLPIQDVVKLLLPVGSTPLHVAAQGVDLCLWVEVTPGAPGMMRTFLIHGTGNPHSGEEGQHVGSAQVGPFVWHVYEQAPSD